MLIIKNLKAGYVKNNMVLKGLDLTIDKNKIVGIIGKNGAGKSTLAKAIMGITNYNNGFISFNNTVILKDQKHIPVSELSKLGIKYFMQGGEIFPNLTVEENLKYAGMNLDRNLYQKKLSQLSELFDVIRKMKTRRLKASHLSGGGKHQLALAMQLFDNPKLLILDEPSAGLSPKNREMTYSSIIRLQKEFSLSMLLIEQNVKYAINYSDELIVMKLGKLERLNKEKIDLKELFLD